MAGVKISQLQDGGALQSTDAFPVARGSLTRKILGAQLLDPLQSLDTRLNALSANTIFVVDSPTIDLTYNNVTRTLSADANYLLTLINTLSSQPKGIVLQQAYNQNSIVTEITYTDVNNRINVMVDTIPTSTQGTLFLTTSATPLIPSSLNNYFLIEYQIDRGYSSTISGIVSLLSQSINGVLNPSVIYSYGAEGQGFYSFSGHSGRLRIPVTSLTPTFFNIRIGINNYFTSSAWLNGSHYNSAGSRNLGGTRISSLLVSEIKG